MQERLRTSVVTVAACLFLGLVPEAAAQRMAVKPVPFFYDLTSNEVWAFSQDHEGFIWAATADGIARWDGHQLQTFRNDERHPHLLPSNATSCVTDGGRWLWVGTQKGLALLDKQTGQLSPPQDKELQTSKIEGVIAFDSDFMVVMYDDVVYRCDSAGHLLQTYRFHEILGLDSTSVTVNNLYVDNGGSLWAVLGRYGLMRYDAEQQRFMRVPVDTALDFFVMLQSRDGRYWVTTYGQGLFEFNPQTAALRHHPVINPETGSEEIMFFAMEQDDVLGHLWLLSENRLYVCDISGEQPHPIDLTGYIEPQKMYTHFLKDREGNLWLSSYDDACVVSFDHAPIQNYIFKVRGWDANLTDLGTDDSGTVYFLQDRLGLCRYDLSMGLLSTGEAATEQSARVLAKTGMHAVQSPDSIRHQLRELGLAALLNDCSPLQSLRDNEALWVVTNKKVIRYDYSHENYLIYTTQDENIRVNQFRGLAAALDGQGGLYVGGHNGFIHIGRERNQTRFHWPHSPVVSEITVADTSAVVSNRSDASHLTLRSGANGIEIYLSSLKFGIGQQPRLAYRIEGLSDDWFTLPPDKYSILFNRFDHGVYHFWLKHEYEPGRWSEGQMVLTITQLPAWYETWWARTVYVLAALGLAWLLLITPFRMSRLRGHVSELMQRHRHHEAVMQRVPDAAPLEDADDVFLQALIKEVETHLSDTGYDLMKLSEALSMSKSTLNRRVKQLTAMTPSDFIYEVRMKRASQLLRESSLTVSEVAYRVGFSDPKYFTRCFRKTFNCSPSAYKKSESDNASKGVESRQ